MENKEITEGNRFLWLDVAKGITILLMILGHTSIPQYISNFIFAFHMPLFFFASGWCTNWRRYSFIPFIKRKFKSLFMPFFLYSITVILIAGLIGRNDLSIKNVIRNGWLGYALWFVPVLFLSLILARSIMLFSQAWVRYTLCGILLLLGVLLKVHHIYLPWTLSTVPYATCLLLLGSSLKKFQDYVNNPKLWIFAVGLLLTLLISQKWRLDLAWNSIIPVTLLTIGAVSGTLMMFTLSSWLTRIAPLSKVFQVIGKETFIILAFSQILGEMVQFFYPTSKPFEYAAMFLLLTIMVLLKNGINRLIGFKLI